MKIVISILICLLFMLTALYPAGVIITTTFGYTFELLCISAFAIAIAAVSVSVIILSLIFKSTPENIIVRILATIIAPLSLMNAIFYIWEHPDIWMVIVTLISAGCCCYLTGIFGIPTSLKTVALTIFALMILPVGFFGYIALLFGNFGQNTVVQTVESPSGKYYAQVIDSDQGALGGDTLVDVYEKTKINAILFKIEKKPQRVYSGDWGEYRNMQIYWKDDDCLVINAVEYELE